MKKQSKNTLSQVLDLMREHFGFSNFEIALMLGGVVFVGAMLGWH